MAKKTGADEEGDFEVAKQAPAPAPAAPAKPAVSEAAEEAAEDEQPKASQTPKYDPGATQARVTISAADMMDTFEAQRKAAAEHHLNQLAMAHPEVRALLDELASLKAKKK